MDISGGGQYADMSENFLKFKEIDAGFQKMRGIAAVAQRMAQIFFTTICSTTAFIRSPLSFRLLTCFW